LDLDLYRRELGNILIVPANSRSIRWFGAQ